LQPDRLLVLRGDQERPSLFVTHFQLNAQGSYKITRSISAYAYGLNLNNEAFGFYNGSPQYVVQREYYKPTYAGACGIPSTARNKALQRRVDESSEPADKNT